VWKGGVMGTRRLRDGEMVVDWLAGELIVNLHRAAYHPCLAYGQPGGQVGCFDQLFRCRIVLLGNMEVIFLL
jgi:hypothetical protein